MQTQRTDGSSLKEARFESDRANGEVEHHRHHPGLWITLVLLILAGGAYFFIVRPMLAKHAESSAAHSATGRGGAIPVVAATAVRGDLPLYLDELGTVIPFNLVTVRTRVGGEVVQVNFKEGQDVKQGELLAMIDPRPFQVQLEQAQGQQGRDAAILNNAKVDLARYQSAAAAVSKQQLDTAAAQVRQYEAIVTSDQAAIDDAKLQLTYCRITAPISGRIGLRRVDQGNIVQANDANGLAVITQLQPISMVFTVSQDDAPSVLRRPNGGVGLAVDAFNGGFTEKLATGVVAAIDNQIDPTTGTLRMKATFQNEKNALFPNEFVNARLLVDTLQGATIVPAAAIQHGPDGDFVYAVKPDQSVEVRPVKAGPTTDDQTAVVSGVSVGDTLVTDGVEKLQPGAKVTVRERQSHRAGASTQPDISASATTRPQGQVAPASSRDHASQQGGQRRSRS